MPLIAIFTEKKEMKDLILQKEKLNINIISKNNINNFKNIFFDIVIIPEKIDFEEKKVKLMMKNAKIIIMNADIEENNKLVKDEKLTIITYGFNRKSTVTASSVDTEELILCIQRSIYNLNNEAIELQEIKTKIYSDVYTTMYIVILKIICSI